MIGLLNFFFIKIINFIFPRDISKSGADVDQLIKFHLTAES